MYSVPSWVIGQMLKIRLWDDRLSCYVSIKEVISSRWYVLRRVNVAPAVSTSGTSLGIFIRKPNAFYYAALRNDILLDDEWASALATNVFAPLSPTGQQANG